VNAPLEARTRVDAWLAESRAWVERELDHFLPSTGASPTVLDEAMRYAVFGGGKRLRPAIVRLVATQFGGRDVDAVIPAAAVELVHTYSLVHDDLPCMDDDDLRRGRPTCHRVYGEAIAVLAGDALLTHAFELLARSTIRPAEMVAALARGAGPVGMVGGQVLDLAGGSDGLTQARVEEIHAKKTAALLGAAAELGAHVGGASEKQVAAARAYGQALGRCFQATDDILDVTGDAATLGKTPGKDARENKPTLVAALGIQGARREAERLAAEVQKRAADLGCRAGDLAFDLALHLLERRS
jgi:geranylgeranyl diphosphate synthase type II